MDFDFKLFTKNNNLPKKGEKVVVAMSGGVDSSVAAVLMLKAGLKVIGVTMQLHQSKSMKKTKTCCSGEDIADARNVAKKFGFKHYIIDYQKEFNRSVINNFIDGYANGETPIPCIKCNQTVKFTDLIKFTKSIGCKFLVTGHYVRRKTFGGESFIYQGIDNIKDQSYFLFATTNTQLEMLRFPLGELKKDKVRELANYFNLKNANKPDSQDICFIPDGNYREFLKKNSSKNLVGGRIEDIDGNFLGNHDGIMNYTIGQRKGIGIGGIKGKLNHKPLYVIRIDKNENKIVVGFKEKLEKYKIYLKGINIISNLNEKKFKADIKVRSGQRKITGLVKILDSKSFGVVELEKPEMGIAPGQACVFYEREKMIGGGWITAAEKEVLTL